MNFQLIYSKILIVACSAFVFSCGSKTAMPAEESVAVISTDIVTLTPAQLKQINLQTASLREQSISGTLKLSGQIDVPPQNLVSVSVPLGGYLRSTAMMPGTQVRKGQLLAVMEDQQYIQLQQDYLTTINKLKFAEKEYDRQKELNHSKASSDKVMQQAENEFRTLSIESKGLAVKLGLIGINAGRLTENSISRTINIYSPINGYVSKVNVNTGKYMTPSDVIFELVNPQDIHLNVTVYEKDLDKLAIGQEVVAYTNSKPDQKYTTRIILISHSLNENRSADVHCHFKRYDKTLVPGMYMNAEVRLNDKKEMVLPDEAFVNFENRDYVFVQQGNGAFKLTPVQKGESGEGVTVMSTAGLEGRQIVTTGAYSLLMKMKNTGD